MRMHTDPMAEVARGGIDVSSLLASFAIGSVGFVLFVYGKRMRRAPQLLVGLTLMIFPYFVDGVVWMSAIAIVLVALLWGGLRAGL